MSLTNGQDLNVSSIVATGSGHWQKMHMCPNKQIALPTVYKCDGELFRFLKGFRISVDFVRVGWI